MSPRLGLETWMASDSRAGTRLWLGCCALLGLAATLMDLAAPRWMSPDSIDWQPALWCTQPWRLFGAALVHYSPLHLGANLLGLGLVTLLGMAARLPPPATMAWLISMPLTHLALLLRPEVLHYGGLSGVLHAAVAVVAGLLVISGTQPQQRIAVWLGLGLLVKIASESPWGPALTTPPGWNMAVVPWAHASGSLSGMFMGMLIGMFLRRARQTPSA